MRIAHFILVVMIASVAPQFSRGRLIGPGCCRTMGGGLGAWDEPSTAEAIAAKRVHDFPMNRTACAVQCSVLKRCTHFELNMYDQPAQSNQGVCSVFASGGYSVTTACKDSSERPRMHCFAAAKLSVGGSSPNTPAVPASMTRSIVLFGAIGRHNFGDLLMAEVHAALLKATGLSPPIFADLLAADMTSVGGRQVVAVGSLFEQDRVTDLIHIGGDILGVSLDGALSMLTASAEQTAAVTQQMQPAGTDRSGYLLPKRLFKYPGAFITNAVGGRLTGSDAKALEEFDFASSRNVVTGMRLVPDSVVLLRQLLDHRVVERIHAPAQQAVHHAMQKRGYWAVQVNEATGSQHDLVPQLAAQLCAAAAQRDVGFVLFRAGTAPFHDSLDRLHQLKRAMRRGGCPEQLPIKVHEDNHIFGICALIAEAELLVATSLHCRIVALNYHVPRVAFASPPYLDKHTFFGYLWDGDAASVEERLVPPCGNQGNQPVHECHAVLSVQRVHQAIKAALKARRDTNWENASAARLERLERLQHHRSFYVWKRTLSYQLA